MAGKSALPLLLAVGAGAVLLSKKKPTTAKKKNGKGNNVVSSGKVERTSIPSGPGDNPLAYEWRVRKSNGTYLAEAGRPETMRDPVVKMWKSIGEADTVEDAEDMALAWIDQQPGYEQDAEVVDSGSMSGGGWQWRVITDPQRGYIGQYKIGEAQWLSAVEAGTYDDSFRMQLLGMGEKAYMAQGG